MNLLEKIYRDANAPLTWRLEESAISVGFTDIDDCWREHVFEETGDNAWRVTLFELHTDHICVYQRIVDAFAQQQEKNENLTLRIETKKSLREYFTQILTPLKDLHDFLIYETIDGDFLTLTASKTYMFESQRMKEILTEEPNTSLMYHKLFPDKKLLRDLESKGYSFQMGSGLKIYKKYYASTHRGSGPSQRRTLQSIVILKDGKFFRKIPKAKWVQLQDPSDKDSVTWGTIFMRKMLADHNTKQQLRHDALMRKRQERLSSNG